VDLPETLRQWIGLESDPAKAPGPIEWSDVRRYVNAIGDANPRWGTPEAEDVPERRGAPVPPAMILDVLRPPAGQDAVSQSGDRPFLSMSGLASTIVVPQETGRLNASTEVEWIRPLRIGDWITVRFKIVDLAAKRTHLGPAVFITEERQCFNQHAQLIAIIRQTTVRILDASMPR